MPSTAYVANAQAVNSEDVELVLLQIDHADLDAPIRVVNDTQDVVSNGQTYIAAPFWFEWPDDGPQRTPRARLAFDNTGRDLMSWIEQPGAAEGATVTVRAIRRSLPNNVEMEVTVGVASIDASMSVIQAELGYANVLDRPAVLARYDPATAPGIF